MLRLFGLHVGQPLRLHRARHLRAHHPGRLRRRSSTWSTTASRPPRCSWSAGFLIKRRGTASIRAMGGVEKVAPVLAGLFLVFGLAALEPARPVAVRLRDPGDHRGVPAPLVDRCDRGHRDRAHRVLRPLDVPAHHDRARPGRRPRGRRPRDLDRREVGTLAPLFLALVLFGFFPMPLLNVINPYVHDTLQHVGVHDPAPTVGPASPREDSSDRARGRRRSSSRTSTTARCGRSW